MKRLLTLVAVSMLAILGIPAGAGAANGLTCGTTVTGDITLTHDLVGCAHDGLIAGAPGITIDLGGYTISGATGNAGVRIPAFSGVNAVTITNGTITGFADGVRADFTDGNHISRLTVTGNTRGINFAFVTDTVVEKNTITDSVLDGVKVDFSDGNLVQKNDLSGNVFGISVSNFSDDNVVTKNAVADGVYGISVFTNALRNEVSRNDVTGNAIVGVQIESGSDDASVARNTVTGNGLGILVKAEVEGATVERNTVFLNSGDGIRIAGDDGVISRNDVYDNGGYGILLTSTAEGNLLEFNNVSGNALGDIAI